LAVDLLRPGLKLLFCGYNPSLTSGHTGYHYAHPGNRFWRVLFAAGITDRLYAPHEDASLLDSGIGFTNLCPRPTRRADELTFTGIGVYKWFRATSKTTWGVQPAFAVPGVTDVVVPSPSGLNRMRFEELVDHYRVLGPFAK
jgi:TDG/mug DNA glycosylase family protein